MSIEKVLYTAHATATGGRDGRAVSSDGVLDVKLVVPKEMGGAGGPGQRQWLPVCAGSTDTGTPRAAGVAPCR